MKYQLENEVTDIWVLLSENGYYDVLIGNEEANEESEILAQMYFKSDALEFAYNLFKQLEHEEKILFVIDETQELQMLAFGSGEEQYIEELIREEIEYGD